MKVWALINKKGGSGKSLLATQLAVYGTQTGLRVLLLDIDPQGSASTWAEERGEGVAPTVFATVPSEVPRATKHLPPGLVDLVIIDTAGRADDGMVAAMMCADQIICPCVPGLFDKVATHDTITLISQSGFLERVTGVASRIPSASHVKSYAEAAASLEDRGVRVAAHFITERVAYRDAVNTGKGVTEMKPQDKKAAKEIQELFNELMETWPVVVAEHVE